MASIIDRLVNIVKANINDLADNLKDPSETVDEYLDKLTEELADVRERTQAIIDDEHRAANAVEKNQQDALHYEDLAKAALRNGNEADARAFLRKKVDLASQGESLQEAYEAIHEAADKMRRLHDRLVRQINEIDERKRAVHPDNQTQEGEEVLGGAPGSLEELNNRFEELEAARLAEEAELSRLRAELGIW